MIDKLYTNIDLISETNFDEHFQSLNGSIFKKISDKNIVYNQKQLCPFYMWTTSGSSFNRIESSAVITTFDQFKYFVTSSVNFANLQRDNKNKGNNKIYFNSASVGYVLSDKTLRYDTFHNGVLYYYGYGNLIGSGSPFNRAIPGSPEDIPDESKLISPSKLTYYSIKNLLSDQNYIKNNRIQVKDNIFIDEFIFVKIPRVEYHEEILKGSFEITLATGSKRLDLADISKYNISYNESSIVYLVSASNSSTINYVSGNLDIYGILDTKNAIAVIDTKRLNTFFGATTFTTNSFSSANKSYINNVYKTESFGVVYIDSSGSTSYTAAYYPNMEVLSVLLYSGSLYKPLKAIGLETQITDEYYIQIGPGEFNKSTNPTYVENFKIKQNFANNPIVYITTIGLYNDDGECLALGKFSKPLKKSYNSSYVIKIEIKQ